MQPCIMSWYGGSDTSYKYNAEWLAIMCQPLCSMTHSRPCFRTPHLLQNSMIIHTSCCCVASCSFSSSHAPAVTGSEQSSTSCSQQQQGTGMHMVKQHTPSWGRSQSWAIAEVTMKLSDGHKACRAQCTGDVTLLHPCDSAGHPHTLVEMPYSLMMFGWLRRLCSSGSRAAWGFCFGSATSTILTATNVLFHRPVYSNTQNKPVNETYTDA